MLAQAALLLALTGLASARRCWRDRFGRLYCDGRYWSTGRIVGVVIGIVIFVILLFMICLLPTYRRRRARKMQTAHVQNNPDYASQHQGYYGGQPPYGQNQQQYYQQPQQGYGYGQDQNQQYYPPQQPPPQQNVPNSSYQPPPGAPPPAYQPGYKGTGTNV